MVRIHVIDIIVLYSEFPLHFEPLHCKFFHTVAINEVGVHCAAFLKNPPPEKIACPESHKEDTNVPDQSAFSLGFRHGPPSEFPGAAVTAHCSLLPIRESTRASANIYRAPLVRWFRGSLSHIRTSSRFIRQSLRRDAIWRPLPELRQRTWRRSNL